MNANEVISNRAIEMAGGVDGQQEARAPERPRQSRAVVERHVSDGHAHRRGRSRSVHHLLPAVATLRDHARRQGARVRGHRQGRPHAPAGCDADHARTGNLRLGRAARSRRARRSRRALPAVYELALGGTAVGTGPQHASGVRGTQRAADRVAHGPAVHDGAEQVCGARRATKRSWRCTAR